MHSSAQMIEEGYTLVEKKRIREIFAELRAASKSKDVQAYIKKVKAGLKG